MKKSSLIFLSLAMRNHSTEPDHVATGHGAQNLDDVDRYFTVLTPPPDASV